VDYRFLKELKGDRKWSDAAESPFMNVGEKYQFWYDDVRSLSLKKVLMVSLQLRGWGMWNAQSLDYNDTEWEEFWKNP
jgi:di-N-acetylchitobiase